MDLDQHADRAADDLRRRVESNVDLPTARASFDAAAGHRRATARRARVGLVGVAAALVALVGLSTLAGPDSRDGGLTTGEDSAQRDVDEVPPDGAARSAAILNALPRGPIDGKASWRLPVVVKPQSGVHDGDTVTVYGRGFEPNQSLGIVQCTAEADTSSSGVGACQLSDTLGQSNFAAVTYATASAEGTVVAEFVVHRYVTTPEGGRIDCQSSPERCLVGVGAVSNYDQSGGAYVDFAGAPPFAQPALSVSPGGPYAPGQQVTAQVTGLVPLRSVRVQQCKGTVCENLIDTKADAAGNVTAAVVVQPTVRSSDSDDEVACDGGCVLRATGIGVKGGSSAPLPDDVPLTFSDAAPVTTPTTAAEAPQTTVETGPSTTVPDGPQDTAVPPADSPTTTAVSSTTPTPGGPSTTAGPATTEP